MVEFGCRGLTEGCFGSVPVGIKRAGSSQDRARDPGIVVEYVERESSRSIRHCKEASYTPIIPKRDTLTPYNSTSMYVSNLHR